jgi:UDP-N-acetylmuramoylalanine--D-glutamate ligase
MVSSSREDQWNVLELSSFQLETTDSLRVRVGAVLNVTADHLDRHYTMENYAETKGRLFRNQQEGDVAVLNADDVLTRAYAGGTPASVSWFSSTREVSPGAWLRGHEIMLGGDVLMPATEVPLRGVHNLENTMAAALLAQAAGASPLKIREAVKTFPGVEHRLEFVRELNGVAWYNDSKATNVDATLKAIAAFPGSLWVILGGKDKDTDYSPLASPLKERAHAALLIGAAAGKIAHQLRGSVELVHCGTLDAAIAEAKGRARAGDTVLLAPACASFDQFENFEHRGREFKRQVRELQP